MVLAEVLIGVAVIVVAGALLLRALARDGLALQWHARAQHPPPERLAGDQGPVAPSARGSGCGISFTTPGEGGDGGGGGD